MSLYYSEDPEYTKISLEAKLIRDKIETVLSKFTREMEGYSYYGSNPGISEDDYEDVAEEIMKAFKLGGLK